VTGERAVVVGTGSLARSICYAVAAVGRRPARVTVLGRSAAAAAEVAYVAGARAALCGTPIEFGAAVADPFSTAAVEEVLRRERPGLVVVAASLQSPWERMGPATGWSALLERSGLGVTLPLQSAIAIDVATAVERALPAALLVNACLPDAVNPLLHALGLAVLCGIGNVALVAASLQAALGLADQRRLQVLAHHVHLHAPEEPADEALAWCEGRPLAGITAMLAPQRAANRRELNQVTGTAAALVLDALLEGRDLLASLPGPLGLPGGYPVRVRGGELTLRLPDGLGEAAAVEWNVRAARRTGVEVADGRVVFSGTARRELEVHLPELADGFRVERVDEARRLLLDLRDRLRRCP
jgi:hypothetical protein